MYSLTHCIDNFCSCNLITVYTAVKCIFVIKCSRCHRVFVCSFFSHITLNHASANVVFFMVNFSLTFYNLAHDSELGGQTPILMLRCIGPAVFLALLSPAFNGNDGFNGNRSWTIGSMFT